MFLAIAALLLLAVIALQNYQYPALRQATISDGLYSTVPDHWLLDGAYVVLATALALAFKGKGLAELLAYVASAALLVTAASNTFSVWVDKVTNGLHNKIHTWFTVLLMLSVWALETTQHNGWKWALAGTVIPGAIAGLFTVFKKLGVVPGPAAEKAAVLAMCSWLVSLAF
jgi:hypothetical protein